METLFERLCASDNKLVVASLKDASKWARLRHTKDDLQLLLTFNIVEIRFRPKNSSNYESLVVTGNNRFINVYEAVDKKTKIVKMHSQFTGIKTKDPMTVMAYDLVDKKLKTIQLDSWEITNLISLTEKNIEILDQIVRDCLNKK